MCVFCDIIKNKSYFYENEYVVAFFDSYPVSKGHTLIVPKRHIENYFDTNEEERNAINKAIFDVKDILETKYKIDGYNIGTNDGLVAGQSVMHLHIHLIPRYRGDMENPKGGVRGVIPEKMKY